MRGVKCSWKEMQRLFDGELPYERREELPGCSGVYVALHEPYVVYVGLSGNLKLRWRQHGIAPLMRKLPRPTIGFARVFEDNLRRAENQWIRALKPLLQRSTPDWFVERLSQEELVRWLACEQERSWRMPLKQQQELFERHNVQHIQKMIDENLAAMPCGGCWGAG